MKVFYSIFQMNAPTFASSRANGINRAFVEGVRLKWLKEDSRQLGKIEIEVPKGAFLECMANYAGMTQNYAWLGDPAYFPNPRRAAYETVDKNLEILKNFLTKTEKKGPNADNFEAGIACLAWVLGFSVIHFGLTPQLQDGGDLIVATPNGNFAVIECTIGTFGKDKKLNLLLERVQAIKQNLGASNHTHLQVLPVIATSKTRKEIEHELKNAEELGILVLGRENLDKIVNELTIYMPNADDLYNKTLKMVQEKKIAAQR